MAVGVGIVSLPAGYDGVTMGMLVVEGTTVGSVVEVFVDGSRFGVLAGGLGAVEELFTTPLASSRLKSEGTPTLFSVAHSCNVST